MTVQGTSISINRKSLLGESMEIINSHDPSSVIVICGPTASGKTSLALELAIAFDGEIISADSRLVYKGMNIGTAKPTYAEMKGIPHHLIDLVFPDTRFTLSMYLEKAKKILSSILSKKKKAILVGGTGLYINALIDGYQLPVHSFNTKKREKLEKLSLQELQTRLYSLDLAKLSTIDKKNKLRLIRAIEIAESGVEEDASKANSLSVCMIGLTAPREILYQRINERVDSMMKKGLLEEVRALGSSYGWGTSALSGIGYKQLGMYCRGEKSLEESISLIKRDSRRYAKRQLTWFKRDNRITWLTV